MKKALITGITGQDGSYLVEYLLDKGYEVHGIKRRGSSLNTQRIDHIYEDPHKSNRNLILHYGDLTDSSNLASLIKKIEPDEIYNLGAQSHVGTSFETPEYTGDVVAMGPLRILEAIRLLGLENKTKYYQASSSEMFGASMPPQNEETMFYPRSPYGVGKLFAYWITRNYREAYGIFASNGILFNHESPRRGETFVTRKIARGAARISLGIQDVLYLGNLDAKRDWGHAKDFVRAMHLILQHKEPDDYVVATGEQYSVRDFCEVAFREVGIDIEWQGAGLDEVGVDGKSGEVVIRIDKRYFRPTEVDSLMGDYSKAERILGWKPSISFEDLVKEMVEFELEEANKEVHLKSGGFKTHEQHND